MIGWSAGEIAEHARARVRRDQRSPGGPVRALTDSRAVRGGELFIGLEGDRHDGGSFAEQALAAGAWGVLVSPRHARRLGDTHGAVLEHPDPLRALANLARSWRERLNAQVIAVTGSTGKTSTKDILASMIGAHRRTASSPENYNTEIGLPLAILAAPEGTEVLVLELAMRGSGQIAELTEIANPDVGVIVNIGPVHLELLGSMSAIAAAKAELIAGMQTTATAVVPAGERLLDEHIRPDVKTLTFGEGGDVQLLHTDLDGLVSIDHRGERITLRPSFEQSHNLHNLLAAVAAARALGITPEGNLQVNFSALRGERIALPGDIVLINDCYNANPISMRAALDELARVAGGRRVAVLGDMLELGEHAGEFHRQVAQHATERRIDMLITVGPLAARMSDTFDGELHSAPDAEQAAAILAKLIQPHDTVLVKGSRGVGLERISQVLSHEQDPAIGVIGGRRAHGPGGG